MEIKPIAMISNKHGAGFAAGFELVDFSNCDPSDIVKLALQANCARREIEAYLAALLVRLGELVGEDAVDAMCEQFEMPRHKRSRQARTAKRLADVPAVMEAVQGGYITLDHAELLADSHSRCPIDQEGQLELVALALRQDCDRFKQTVAGWEERRMVRQGKSRTERQRSRRTAKVFDGDHEMVVLHAELDQIAGERVKVALDAMSAKMLKHDSQTGGERTFEQRNADALVTLVTQEPGKSKDSARAASDSGQGCGCEGPGCGDWMRTAPKPQKTTLILTADYDAVARQLKSAGLIDGTPVELDEMRRLACEAEILPAIFNAASQPLYMGRARRAPTKAQKLAIMRRDRACTGCGLRPQACDYHHVLPWEDGGSTDVPNLVLLCPKCHRKSHRHDKSPPSPDRPPQPGERSQRVAG